MCILCTKVDSIGNIQKWGTKEQQGVHILWMGNFGKINHGSN